MKSLILGDFAHIRPIFDLKLLPAAIYFEGKQHHAASRRGFPRSRRAFFILFFPSPARFGTIWARCALIRLEKLKLFVACTFLGRFWDIFRFISLIFPFKQH